MLKRGKVSRDNEIHPAIKASLCLARAYSTHLIYPSASIDLIANRPSTPQLLPRRRLTPRRSPLICSPNTIFPSSRQHLPPPSRPHSQTNNIQIRLRRLNPTLLHLPATILHKQDCLSAILLRTLVRNQEEVFRDSGTGVFGEVGGDLLRCLGVEVVVWELVCGESAQCRVWIATC